MEQELLEACEKGEFDRARQLISKDYDPNSVKDGNGWTPLHWACWHGNLDFVKTLVEDHSCDPECRTTTTVKRSDNDVVPGTTPLHLASRYGRLDVVTYLTCEGRCDPMSRDENGSTPLHHACRNGCADIVRFLLTKAQCDSNCTTKDGDTPLSLTTDPVIIRELLKHGADPKKDYAKYSRYLPSSYPKEVPEPVVKVFVVGDRGTGKSTLTEAIKIHSKSSTGLSRLVNRIKKVPGVEARTAGITPHDVRSARFGPVTLYDLSGHKEYYSSNDSIVRNAVMGSSGAVFLLVTDLRTSDEEFRKSFLFWLTFITDKSQSSLDTKPHVIVIGSHANMIKSKQELSGKSQIVATLQNAAEFSTLHFNGYVAMNCCYAESSAMSELCRRLAESCDVLRSKVVSTFRSHCFFFYLLDRFRESPAVRLSEVHHAIESELKSDDLQLTDFLPHTMADLCTCCEELNERGNVIFLKDTNNIENSWIILDKMTVLSRVTGTVFAPAEFKEYLSLATSIGVVPFSKFRSAFPDFDPDMIIQFLCHLEFCHEITDPEILSPLHHGYTDLATPNERFFYFPALISIAFPDQLWETNSQFSYHCGWLLQCFKPAQFFTPRFLQALLLRLAFSFALVPEYQLDHPALQRRCTVWKNGLYWAGRSGVEALVEVVDERVTVLLRCLRSQEIECVQFRSAIIRKVINAKEELCPKVSTTEYFVLPEDATQYPLKPQSELSLVSCTELASATALGELATLDTKRKIVTIEELLHFEPYAHLGETILRELFDDNNPMVTQVVSDDFLTRFAWSNHSKNAAVILSQALTPHGPPLSESIQDIFDILQLWRSQTMGTYQCLRRELDKFSVFAGRNPLDMAGVVPSQQPTSLVLSKPNRVQVFYERKETPNIWMVHCVFVKNLQECKNAIIRNYSAGNVEPGPKLDFEFEQDCVHLDVPFEGITLESGWEITPITYPMITKEGVDSYSTGLATPSCQMQIRWTGSGDVPEFVRVVELQGAKPPNTFTLQYHPGSPVPTSSGSTTALIRPWSGKPTLVGLLRFRGKERRINIPQEIGTRYMAFGILLLEDSAGVVLDAIHREHLGDVESTNLKVLQRWLAGKGRLPVSWQTLIEVLEDMGLSELARDIRDVTGNTR